ncbi:bifunctional lysylphosphatidylglycerol flippase/synthetase MprF [Burkholderia sp. SIMBA_062]|uniref:bifunctional lysylphosphatidylglycerol flippase/synthetase MprF n=1 Tax=Burkholderia sp. SIMBA_062 TaxID=3085803 RepID=UPI00397D330F
MWWLRGLCVEQIHNVQSYLLLVIGVTTALATFFLRLLEPVGFRFVTCYIRRLATITCSVSLVAMALGYLALVARDVVGRCYVAAKVPRVALRIRTIVGTALNKAIGFGGWTGIAPARIVSTSGALVQTTAVGMVCVQEALLVAQAMPVGFPGFISAYVAVLNAYRVIYFGVPLVLSAGLLAGFEGRALRRRFVTQQAVRVSQLAPVFLSLVTFAVGGMLVISSATPAFWHRMAIRCHLVPLWVLEGSQVIASVLGVALLFVARGLLRRLDGAWWMTFALTLASLALSLAKGLAFVEAGVLGTLLVLLLVSRRRFNRHSSLLAERFTVNWFVSVTMVLMLAVWVLFFAFRDVPYTRDLWSHFSFDARAPRALRATLAAGVFVALFALWQLLRPAPGRFVKPVAQDLLDAEQIIRAQECSDAGLALMGDKSFLFSESRRAFLMYAKNGRTWAALHDPVGPRDEWPALISKFIALAHAHSGRAAFYQVRANALPLYLDAGLTLMKLGEEAHIALDRFDLKGSNRSHLRYALRRGDKDALSVEVIAPCDVPAALPALRDISDGWLDSRDAREKSFSVAAFHDGYLATQSVMLVRQADKPIAFVTFMTTDLNTEATVGVMRHLPEASPYAMEYLFTQLALHLKEAGFLKLSLGIAPFSGMGAAKMPSPWHRFGLMVWRFGGRFYNFRGLRAFKSKFEPHWEPRYLAASGSVGVFVTLADLSLLAGGRRS